MYYCAVYCTVLYCKVLRKPPPLLSKCPALHGPSLLPRWIVPDVLSPDVTLSTPSCDGSTTIRCVQALSRAPPRLSRRRREATYCTLLHMCPIATHRGSVCGKSMYRGSVGSYPMSGVWLLCLVDERPRGIIPELGPGSPGGVRRARSASATTPGGGGGVRGKTCAFLLLL